MEIRDDELQIIKTETVTIDLPTGRLSVDSTCEWLPEQITWAFCVGTLYVVAQKTASSAASATASRPSSLLAGSVRSVQFSSSASDPEVESIGTSATTSAAAKKSKSSSNSSSGGGGRTPHAVSQKKLAKRRKMSASFTFLLACGLQIDATLYGSPAKPPSSRGSPAAPAGHYRSQPNVRTDESSLSEEVTFVRNGPAGQPNRGVTQYTPNGLRNAIPGVYSFPQTIVTSSSLRNSRHSTGHVYSSASLQHHSSRLVSPPAHVGIAGSTSYVDIRL